MGEKEEASWYHSFGLRGELRRNRSKLEDGWF